MADAPAAVRAQNTSMTLTVPSTLRTKRLVKAQRARFCPGAGSYHLPLVENREEPLELQHDIHPAQAVARYVDTTLTSICFLRSPQANHALSLSYMLKSSYTPSGRVVDIELREKNGSR